MGLKYLLAQVLLYHLAANNVVLNDLGERKMLAKWLQVSKTDRHRRCSQPRGWLENLPQGGKAKLEGEGERECVRSSLKTEWTSCVRKMEKAIINCFERERESKNKRKEMAWVLSCNVKSVSSFGAFVCQF